MNFARLLLLPIALLVGAASTAEAHAWYPKECCADHDCMLADDIDVNAHGERVVLVGRRLIFVPQGLAARPSPDGRVHICLSLVAAPEGDISLMPICLFMPPQS